VATDEALRRVIDAAASYGDHFDEATLALDPPVRLVRQADVYWKVRTSSLLVDGRPPRWLDDYAEGLRQTAEAIRARRYATFAEADADLRRRIAAAAAVPAPPPPPPPPPAATRPAAPEVATAVDRAAAQLNGRLKR